MSPGAASSAPASSAPAEGVVEVDADRLVADADAALARVETLPDDARAVAVAAIQQLLELYGEAIRRLAGALRASGGPDAIRNASADDLVGHLLLLHAAHPVPLEERVRGALDEVRPYLASHGGDVELLAVEDGAVRVRLHGSCAGCASSSVTLKLAVEEAIGRLAPEIERVVAEDEGAEQPVVSGLGAGGSFIPIDALRRPPTTPGGWRSMAPPASSESSRPEARDVGGRPLILLTAGSDRYAYDRSCPACTASLADGTLDGDDLVCARCGRTYDVRHAGRERDGGSLHLEPVPLLVGADGSLRIAIGAATP